MCFCSACGSSFSRFVDNVGRRSVDGVASSLRKLRNSRLVAPSPAPSEKRPDDATTAFRGVFVPGPLSRPRSDRPPRPRPRAIVIDVSLDVFTSL